MFFKSWLNISLSLFADLPEAFCSFLSALMAENIVSAKSFICWISLLVISSLTKPLRRRTHFSTLALFLVSGFFLTSSTNLNILCSISRGFSKIFAFSWNLSTNSFPNLLSQILCKWLNVAFQALAVPVSQVINGLKRDFNGPDNSLTASFSDSKLPAAPTKKLDSLTLPLESLGPNLRPQISCSSTIGINAFITSGAAWFISSKNNKNFLSGLSSIIFAHDGIAISWTAPLLPFTGTGIPPKSDATALSK